MDNYYPIEIKIVSKNGYHTPAEARAYYGRYSREGVTVHWWNSPDQVAQSPAAHDQIVNFITAGAARGERSVNYVLSDYKITLLVNPDDVAWASQGGNPTTISVETDPHITAEGYKKWGWLVWQLEGRYGHRLSLYPHNHWFQTACPGNLDINRIRAEADKWANGGYNPQPQPVPTPQPEPTPTPVPVVNLKVTDIPNKKVRFIRDANLWNLGFKTYSEALAVKPYKAGDVIEDVSAIAEHPLGSKYYITEYSFKKGIQNGINVKDVEDVVEPIPTPPVVVPPVVEPPKPPVEVPVVLPTEHDKVQDAKLNAIQALLQKVVDFLSSIFKNFN